MIENYEFGSYIIDGKKYEYDIKLINNKVKIWHGRINHYIFVKDVEDLIAFNPELIIIGTGFYGKVRVKDEVVKFAEDKGIELVILPTKEACNAYNKALEEGKNVCGIFHGTC